MWPAIVLNVVYAVLIGVSHVDSAAYASGWEGQLFGPSNDVRAMLERFRAAQPTLATGHTIVLQDEKAKRATVTDVLYDAAGRARAGDLVLVYYSGHGAQSGTMWGEADKLDERWCLYDGLLLDKEFGAVLDSFGTGVRVEVITDACHSETITYIALLRHSVERAVVRVQSMFRARDRAVVKEESEVAPTPAVRPRGRLKAIPDEIARRTLELHQDVYEPVMARLAKRYTAWPPKWRAQIIHWSACAEGQLAEERADDAKVVMGDYTRNWMTRIKKGAFDRSCHRFEDDLETHADSDHKPHLAKLANVTDAILDTWKPLGR